MKTEWDYTHLAQAYLKRPDYSVDALDQAFAKAGLKQGSMVCDVGAGVAHLSIPMIERGFNVEAVEPNDEMRRLGKQRTSGANTIQWFEGTGEQTGRPAGRYDAITFGSSFNVTDRTKSLMESQRIGRPKAWFICMWNHRDLSDPTQSAVENLIKSQVAEYNYGTRREDQRDFLEKSGILGEVTSIEGSVVHKISVDDYVEAWRSHATLHRQAGSKFSSLISEIEDICKSSANQMQLRVPYVTRLWMAQFRTVN